MNYLISIAKEDKTFSSTRVGNARGCRAKLCNKLLARISLTAMPTREIAVEA
jgi:hypothetical protein